MRVLPLLFLAVLMAVPAAHAETPQGSPPNVVIIFADDLGYGDLGCFGHPTIETPNLDKMAGEGQRWTDFYVAAPICSPSRAGLMTGRYPVRTGTAGGVFFEYSASGLDPSEVTIAEMLKQRGYHTAIVGKWHLGHTDGFLPQDQGFDEYYGIPYSNDMRVDPHMPVASDVVFREGMSLEKLRSGKKVPRWVPLMRGKEVVEYPADQTTLTRRYTDHCIDFIRKNKDQPFFLYYAQSFPHVPLFAGKDFLGSSRRGIYGDVVEELDSSVGEILQALRDAGVADNTLVVFTSDNGPWLTQDVNGGSAGLLRGGKGQTWDGGMREPTIFWWPGHVMPGRVGELGSTLDMMPTIARLTGAKLPEGVDLDGYDLSPVLLKDAASPRDVFYYYRDTYLAAIRYKQWKAHFATEGVYGRGGPKVEHNPPLLFNLFTDPGELYDVAKDHPDVVEQILKLKAEAETNIRQAPSRYPPYLEAQVDVPDWVKERAAKAKAAGE